MYKINNDNPISETVSLIKLDSLLLIMGKLNNEAFIKMILIQGLTKFKSSFFFNYFNITMEIKNKK